MIMSRFDDICTGKHTMATLTSIQHTVDGGGGGLEPPRSPSNEDSVRGNSADEGVIKVHPTPKNRFTAV